MKTGNMDLIRNINRQRVLDVIKHFQPVSRAVISRKLSLSRSTVSMIVNDLIEDHSVVELGMGESTMNGGRKGTMLGFNPRSAFGIGIDLQGGSSRIVLADLDGNVTISHSFTFDRDLGKFKTLLKKFLSSLSDEMTHLVGIGISVPSIVKDHEIVVDAPSLGWQNLNLAEELSDVTNLNLFTINDVNAAAFGERWLGQDRQIDNLFYLSIGTGVGSAIIANGGWVSGADQAAGEIGYMLENKDVNQHDTYVVGQFGTFEKKVTSLLAAKKTTPEIRNELVTQLSVAFANISSLLNPEKIIIGGPYQQKLEPLIGEIQKKVQQYSPLPAEIAYSALGWDAAAIGALEGLYHYLRDQTIN
ncbi:ROK family transcriptional regulator [Sporolactobacillus pectinivorans]|uniref:ROK family transcriptional regulator n=1 Tax=Sporolactobacillus pectinivorans TaxID=1591408 RepID=UPI0012FD05F0|nr:ROK family transcriptional regulator [Sporolactobacillus pectinivorans]